MNTPIKTPYITALFMVFTIALIFIVREMGDEAVTQMSFVPFTSYSQTAAVADFDTSLVGHYLYDNASSASTITDAPQLDNMPTLTISMWVKANSSFSSKTILSKRHNAVPYSAYGISVDTLSNRAACTVYNSTGSTATAGGATNSLSVGSWHHVVCVYDGSSLSVYTDGVKGGFSGSLSGSVFDSNGSLMMPFTAFDGSVANVRIYSTRLSDPQIAELYAEKPAGAETVNNTSGVTITPTPGQCSTQTINLCTAGVFSDTADSPTHVQWNCLGSDGGATASCSLPIASVVETATPPAPEPTVLSEPTVTHPPSTGGDIIPANRRIDWTHVGVPGGIPNRTTVCATINATTYGNGTTDAAAAINAAVQACPANQVVYIPAGTYLLNSPITLKTDTTLRGAGPGQTILRPVSTTAVQSGSGGALSSERTVISGATKGSTSITVNDTSGIQIGSIIDLYEQNDPDLFWTRWTNDPRVYDQMGQFVLVTAVNGQTISFQDPLVWNFTSNPRFKYWNGRMRTGVENMTISADAANHTANLIFFTRSYATWVKNVETIGGGGNAHIGLQSTLRNEIRDSYMHDTYSTADGYGIQSYFNNQPNGRGGSSGTLFENNAFAGLRKSLMLETDVGSVISYNYSQNIRFLGWPNYMESSINANHGPHGMMDLYEGNIVESFQNDGYHGSTSHLTLFRNWFSGHHINPSMTGNLITVSLERYSYYHNVVGNVLGFSPWPSIGRYEMTGNPGYTAQPVIYRLGYPNMGNNLYSATNPPSNPSAGGHDPKVKSTLLRWGNYDYFNRAVNFNSDEIPSDTAVPSTQSLPASLYLSSRPAWFGSIPFPPIGPDVSGGNAGSSYANKIPAQICFEQGRMPNCLAQGGNSSPTQNQQPTPSTQPAGTADFNHDGSVNTLDFSLLQSAWNQNTTTYDLNHDSTVNSLDYSIMAQQWTG